MRPYEELLLQAGQTGTVLKRENIYGSGPPVDALSGETQLIVKEHCHQHRSIVDFGAGCGALQQYLPESVAYLGLETNPHAVAMARARGRNVVLGDVTASGLEDNSFEVCTMIEVLEHINDYDGALREARRVCSSKLLMTVPNIGVLAEMSEFQVVPWHILEATHVNFFTPASLEKILGRYFSRVQVWEIHEWFKPGLHMNIAAIGWK